jgi:hypothetical protein
MLGFMIVTTSLLLILSPLVHRLLGDVPGSHRLLETHAQLQGIVSQIQYDIDRAVDLPSEFGGQAADEEYLFISQSDGTIVWQHQSGRVARLGPYEALPDLADPNLVVSADLSCSIPQARLSWKLHMRNDKAIAVEIETAAIQKIETSGKERLKMAWMLFLPREPLRKAMP